MHGVHSHRMLSLFPPPQPPPLPDFSSILIAGPYHQSALIHLALSATASTPPGSSIIFAPSKDALKEGLQLLNDAWLTAHSGEGATVEISSKVTIFYPPTPAHLCLLLSLLHVSNEKSLEYTWASSQTVLPTAPNLIIITELSSYFLNPDDESSSSSSDLTLPSYLNLVNRILISLSSMKRSSTGALPKLALFDSRLSNFKLPVTNQHQRLFSDGSSSHPQEMQALPLVERFFQWVGIFEEDSAFVPSSQGEESTLEGQFKQLRMYRPNDETDTGVQFVTWTEKTQLSELGTGLQETQFRGFNIRSAMAV
ncbi:hypothetical protein CVT26_008507 [Gymnopilus dilepis]|uniref:Uncharacterized protein n=1 Tax=Gymnopilus dilepis TaxID=231916 RepID=A0A409XXJ2_9AGAR|nr:hypothetical protein CVT26_008507 [Gymnopilus dilepis]